MRCLFCIILAFVALQCLGAESALDKVRDVTLQNFSTHGLDAKGNLSWRLTGGTAQRNGSIVMINDFLAEFHQADGRTYELRSPSCRFLQSLKEVKSDAPVRLVADGIFIEGIGYDAYLEGRMIRIRSSVRAVLKGYALKLDTEKVKKKE